MSTDIEFLQALNDGKPTEPPPALISEYIHNRRIMPPGSPMPGPLDVGYTPYFRQIMDGMGPYSDARVISVCKGVQIGATANCAENVIAYYMDANPAEILYCSATDALLERWTKRLEPMIDSCGFRHKIAAQVQNTKSRKTGDKMYSKEYPGGSLSMASLQSPAALRSESKQIVIIDEIDGAPAKTFTGEGSPLHILHGRAAAFGGRGRFMEFSTPGTFERSVIWRRYETGDQRRYFVPCPKCDAYQVLEFKQLRPEYIGETLQYAWYECEHCGGRIYNESKTKMLAAGEWRATAQPRVRKHWSYHISTLYSPVGMTSWTGVYQKYLDAEEDPTQKPSFTNLYLGMPYKEEGSRPDVKKVIALRGNYRNGTVPDGVLYLTIGGDVQRGAKRFQEMEPEALEVRMAEMKKQGRSLWRAGLPRVEVEVLGIGSAYRTWSVDYKVFYGHTTLGGLQGAFEKFHKWFDSKASIYIRSDGLEFEPMYALIDGTDGVTQAAVFEFCEQYGPHFCPTINSGWLKAKKDPGVDLEGPQNFDRYRYSRKTGHQAYHIQTATNVYKKRLYSQLKNNRNAVGGQPPGFCEFPRDRPDFYFDMLTAEEMRIDGSFHNGGRPAEALDCRVYAMCAGDVWLEAKVLRIREAAKKKGCPDDQIQSYDKKHVLAELGKVTARSTD